MKASAHAHTATVQAPKSHKDIVFQLQSAAKASPVFNAVCHIFAIRERARQQVMVNTLQARMAKEGFTYSTKELESVLKTMASLGLGKIQHDSKGRILGLKEIRMTLQSIGLAAVSKVDKLEGFSPSTVFSKLPTDAAPSTVAAATVPAPMRRSTDAGGQIKATVLINGKQVIIEAKPEDIVSVLAKLVLEN